MRMNAKLLLTTVVGGAAMAAAAQRTSASTLLQYNFNEGSGTTATDSSGNGNNGVIANGSYVTGASYVHEGGYALSFNGSNTTVTPQTPAHGSISTGNNFTIDVWVNIPTGTSSIQTIAADAPSGGSNNGFAFYVNNYQTTDQKLVFESAGGGKIISTSTVPFGGLHEVTATVTNANTSSAAVSFSIDGVSAGGGTIGHGGIFDTTQALQIGAFTGGSAYDFHGTMDSFTLSTTPEPASLGLLALGGLGLLSRRRRAGV